MVKWLKGFIFTITVLLILLPLTVYGYIKHQHSMTEKETYKYLIEYGYDSEDILSIESKIKKLSLFTAEVIFTDEPDVIYDYQMTNKKVIQLGPTVVEEAYDYKHLE